MEYLAYIRICMLSILLSGINFYISAQTVDKKIEWMSDSTNHRTEQSIAGTNPAQPADSLSRVVQTRSCMNTFTNQTVSSNVSVLGCSTLSAQNITVTSSGMLSLIAPSDVIINGTFDVLPGGTLNVQGEAAPIPISSYTYTYDAAGNRITRQPVSARSAVYTDETDSHEVTPLSDTINNNHNSKKE
jgi:hypothetical protein